MSKTIFEYPLNEKVRNYLRVESLLRSLKSNIQKCDSADTNFFFEQLFTLLDFVERVDLRTEIGKDLDAHERNLVHWSAHPNINDQALKQTLRTTVSLRDQVKSAKKFGADLKEDKFLSAIRQRFSIRGGTFSFDLPILDFWQRQPAENRKASMQNWLEHFSLVGNCVDVLLSFLREKAPFKVAVAEKGLHQSVADDRCELIRVKYDADKNCYPTVSGNRYRYIIRFSSFDHKDGSSRSFDGAFPFEYCVC